MVKIPSLDVISVISHKCIARFKATWHGFPHLGIVGPKTNQHKNMSCFGGSMAFVSIGQKLHVTKHEPRNKNLKTYHPLKTCPVLTSGPTCVSMFEQPKPPKHIPSKHVMFQELCFGLICPSSMFPHVIPIHAP